uniref:Uncharacterized protein n=1 Tax=Peronospora matthiolae TaxID=2874970 RepID=A0AAV1UKT3_9STRA
MFEALVADMTVYQGTGYVDVWKETLQELFTAEYSRLSVRTELLPAEHIRYPTLKGKELVCFLGLFQQIFVLHKGSFTEWQRLARAVGQELLGLKMGLQGVCSKAIQPAQVGIGSNSQPVGTSRKSRDTVRTGRDRWTATDRI